ncbi:MAG: hypothetical protein ABSA91_02215 [Acidimicrobiales bacterium]
MELPAGVEPTHLRVGQRDFKVLVDGHSLVVMDTDGRPLDPRSAHVLVALGGEEPDWVPVVEALSVVPGEFPDDIAAVATAARVLGLRPEDRAGLARTSTDREVLLALAASGQYQIGANPLCDVKLWDFVRYHRKDEVQSAALQYNEVLGPRLGNHPDPETLRRVAANPACPTGLLVSLGEKQEPAVRAAVARNPRAPAGTLLNLAQDKDNVWVRAGVAANPSCPPEAYRKLMWDRQASVRNALLVNPTVPRKVVARQIFHDPTAAVHVALASRADLTPRQLSWLERYSRLDPPQQYKVVRRRLAQHPSCSPKLGRRLDKIERHQSAVASRRRKGGGPKTAWYRFWVALARCFAIAFVATSLLLAVIGLAVAAFGPRSGSGAALSIAIFGWALVIVECLAAVLLLKSRAPFLTWKPPRLGRVNRWVPLMTSIFLATVLGVATGSPAVLGPAFLMTTLAFVVARSLRTGRWTYRPWWMPKNRQ